MHLPALQPHLKAADLPLEKLAANSQITEREKIAAVSQAFEAVLLRQILQAAQKTVFSSQLIAHSTATGIYQDVVTNQLAESIAKSGAFGLAKSIEPQLQAQSAPAPAGSATLSAHASRPAAPTPAQSAAAVAAGAAKILPSFMLEILHPLIESLREELKQYGEMLRLLEQEQAQVVQRLATDLLQTVTDIQSQGAAIQTARRQREHIQQELARHLQQLEGVALSEIIPLLPPDYRPLLEALVAENNQLLFRIQQRARQNHLLLNRSLELMQQFINSFCPATTPVYTESGSLLSSRLVGRSLYDAVG